MYKRVIAVLIATFLAIAGIVAPALAGTKGGGNPHFVKVIPSVQDDGSLSVYFKEAGLGKKRAVRVNGKAFVTVKYACVEKDDKGAVKKVTKYKDSRWVYADKKVSGKASGNFKGTLHFSVPDVTCAKGEAVILKVKWTCVVIWDECTKARATVRGKWVWKAPKEEVKDDCGCDYKHVA